MWVADTKPLEACIVMKVSWSREFGYTTAPNFGLGMNHTHRARHFREAIHE